MDEQEGVVASQRARPVIVDVQTILSREVNTIQCSCSLTSSFLCNVTAEFFSGVNVYVDLIPDAAPFRSTAIADVDDEAGGEVALFLRRYPRKDWECILTIAFSLAEISFERQEGKGARRLFPLEIMHNGKTLHLPADTKVISPLPHVLE